MSEDQVSPTTLSAAPPMGGKLGSQLSIMMFLQYAIWGAWLPLMYLFLSSHRSFDDGQIGWMFMAGGVGALLGPFIAGQVADRYFNTEKFLALSHIIGGALVWQLTWIDSFWGFLIFSLLYSMVYSPTLALTNSLAFHHIPDRDRDFGRVRVWGTVGWILVGIGIGQWLLYQYTPADATAAEKAASQAAGIADAFRLSAILGIIMGIYCFTLPKTPPAKGKESNAALEALGEAKRQPLLTLFLLAVPISCIHQFYFIHTGPFLNTMQNELADGGKLASSINKIFGVGGGGLMTIGQMSEILVLACIPLVAKRMSRKSLLAVGLAAYGLRMFLFAYVDIVPLPVMATLILGVALHGLCFGCFIFVAFMVVDEETTSDVRASAQNLFNLVIVGIGIIVGSLIAGYIGGWARDAATEKMNYTVLFSIPMWTAVVCLAVLIAVYPKKKTASATIA